MKSYKNLLLIFTLCAFSMQSMYSIEEESFNIGNNDGTREEAPGLIQRVKDSWYKRKLSKTLQDHAKNLDYTTMSDDLSDEDYKTDFHKRIQLKFDDNQKEAFNKLSTKAQKDVTNDWLESHNKSKNKVLQAYKQKFESDLNNFTKTDAKDAISKIDSAKKLVNKNNEEIKKIDEKLKSKKLTSLERTDLDRNKTTLTTDKNAHDLHIKEQYDYIEDQKTKYKTEYETAVENFTHRHSMKTGDFEDSMQTVLGKNKIIRKVGGKRSERLSFNHTGTANAHKDNEPDTDYLPSDAAQENPSAEPLAQPEPENEHNAQTARNAFGIKSEAEIAAEKAKAKRAKFDAEFTNIFTNFTAKDSDSDNSNSESRENTTTAFLTEDQELSPVQNQQAKDAIIKLAISGTSSLDSEQTHDLTNFAKSMTTPELKDFESKLYNEIEEDSYGSYKTNPVLKIFSAELKIRS
jgi:hypothetical protein